VEVVEWISVTMTACQTRRLLYALGANMFTRRFLEGWGDHGFSLRVALSDACQNDTRVICCGVRCPRMILILVLELGGQQDMWHILTNHTHRKTQGIFSNCESLTKLSSYRNAAYISLSGMTAVGLPTVVAVWGSHSECESLQISCCKCGLFAALSLMLQLSQGYSLKGMVWIPRCKNGNPYKMMCWRISCKNSHNQRLLFKPAFLTSQIRFVHFIYSVGLNPVHYFS